MPQVRFVNSDNPRALARALTLGLGLWTGGALASGRAEAGACPADIGRWEEIDPRSLPTPPVGTLLPDALPDAAGRSEGLSLGDVVPSGPSGSALAWTACDERRCEGFAAALGPDGRVLARLVLPGAKRGFAVEGVLLQPSGWLDVDGDGAAEWVLPYTVVDPPRAAVGVRHHERVAVLRLPTLDLLWSGELRTTGGDSEEACEGRLLRAPNGSALALTRRCAARAELEGGAAVPEQCELWSLRQGRYR